MTRQKVPFFIYFLSLVLSLSLPITCLAEAAGVKLENPIRSLDPHWTVNTQFSSYAPTGFIKGNQEFVVVGANGTLIKSKDGANWTTYSSFNNTYLSSIAWSGSTYVLFGAQQSSATNGRYQKSAAYISKDAVSWTPISFQPGVPVSSVVWGKDRFIAAGESKIFSSADGVNWELSYQPPAIQGATWDFVYYVNQNFIVSTYDGKHMLHSKDGKNWSYKNNPSVYITNVIWSGKQYVGVGDGIYNSKDGITWTKLKQPQGYFSAIASNGTVFVAAGIEFQSDGTRKSSLVTSKDGVTWQQHSGQNIPAPIAGIVADSGQFIGVTSFDPMYPESSFTMTSKDGVNWTSKLLGSPGGFSGLATNGKRTVAVGLDGSIIYTDNGIHWNSSHPLIGRPHLFKVVWDGKKFVAVGNKGAYYSSDGIRWSHAPIKFNYSYGGLRDLLWTGSFFVATDQVNGTYTSRDGISWTAVKSINGLNPNYWIQSMITDGPRVLAAARVYANNKTSYKLIQSTDGQKWSDVFTIGGSTEFTGFFLSKNGSSYLLIGISDRAYTWSSKDGKQWSQVKNNLSADVYLKFVTAIDQHYAAFSGISVRKDGVINNIYYTSKDGANWVEVPYPRKDSFDEIFDEVLQAGIKAHGKSIFVGAYGVIMSTPQLPVAPTFTYDVTIDGRALRLPPGTGRIFIDNGTTYVPLRVIGEHLGYEVHWDPLLQKVTFINEEHKFPFTSQHMKNIEGRTHVPLRELTESMSFQVEYERIGFTHKITIK